MASRHMAWLLEQRVARTSSLFGSGDPLSYSGSECLFYHLDYKLLENSDKTSTKYLLHAYSTPHTVYHMFVKVKTILIH